MFGFIKNLMGERGPESAPPAPEELPPPILPPGSTAAKPADTAAAAPASPAPAGDRPPADGLHIKSSVTHSGRVVLSFKAITDKFPATLRATLATPPDAATLIALKLDDILPQLSTGRVEVPLADLRRMAPLGSFVDDTSRDAEKVSIPLDELLPKLDSTLLQTTKARERIEVPSDIATPFRKQGEAPKEEPPALERQLAPGIQAPSEIQALFAKSGKTAPTPTPMPERAPAPEPVRPLPVTPPPAEQRPPAAAPSPTESAVVLSPIKLSLRPSASQTISGPIPAPSPASSAPATVPLSVPSPAMPPVAPAEKEAPPPLSRPPASIFSRRPIVDAPAPITSRLAGVKDASTTTSRLSASGPIRQPAPISAPETGGGPETLGIPLTAVSKQWPEAIRDEIASAAPSAVIAFPKAELESALKQGKVSVRWARLRGWVAPAQGLPAVSLYDEAMVELPLPVVAPLFMAAAKPSTAARRVTVDESMPALFQPAGAAAAPPSSSSASAAPPPIPAAAAAPAIRGAGASAPGVEGRQPSILVDRACALRGVAGAVVALADGLLVAASVPKEFTAETIAAFLPQVFSRLEQAAGSMKIGEVQHLSFIAGERTWQIWRAGELFFAAIGTPNEMLPGAQLKILAAQLARQTRG